MAIVGRNARGRGLRLYGMDIAPSAGVRPGCWFGGPNVPMGPGTFVNVGCFFDASASIEIGASCSLAMGVSLITSTHELGPTAQRAGPARSQKIVIEDGAWLGARVLVQPGVTVGSGAVVLSGAVVTSDCLPDTMYGGVPARPIDRPLPN